MTSQVCNLVRQHSVKSLLYDYSLIVNVVTLIFIAWRGSAISSAKKGKSGSDYSLVKS